MEPIVPEKVIKLPKGYSRKKARKLIQRSNDIQRAYGLSDPNEGCYYGYVSRYATEDEKKAESPTMAGLRSIVLDYKIKAKTPRPYKVLDVVQKKFTV